MSKAIDLTGRQFGRLLVICKMGKTSDGRITWLCQCQCGNHKVARGKLLVRGDSQSCGCLFKESRHWPRKGSRAIDLTGRFFGRWLVLCRMANVNSRPRWLVQCRCKELRIVGSNSLLSGSSQSCGCLSRERTQAWAVLPRTHGMTNSPEHRVWQGIKTRTTNPKASCYHRYGGRGILMCERWFNDFQAFYEDMGPRPSPKHTIERLDNDGPYSPENCRWATIKEQTRNKSTNVRLTYKGEHLCVAEWAERYGIPRSRLYAAAKSGATSEEELAILFGDNSIEQAG